MKHYRHLALAALLAFSLGVARAQETPAPVIVGYSEEFTLVPDLALGAHTGKGGFYATLIERIGATFVKPHFVDVNLRAGDRLTIRSANDLVVETITLRGPADRGTFYGLSAFGDELVIEFEFAQPYVTPPFRIDHLVLGNSNLLTMQPKSVCPPEDFDDVICYQSDAPKWKNVLASVGVMNVGGNPVNALWCSGSNVSPLNYLLTNFHCIGSQGQCANAEFVFKYYRTQCNTGAPPTTDWQGFHCSQFVKSSPLSDCEATLSTLDFSLNSVIGDPAATFGYAQPDSTPLTDGEAIYIVQHPAGRPHEITHGSGANVDVSGANLRYYNTLDTDGGSSGSPIFRDANDLLVGLHHCGPCSSPGIGNRGMLMSDIYPHIAPFICEPALKLVFKATTPLEEVYGNGDPFLDPGETWEFRLQLTNLSCLIDATGVTCEVGPAAGTTSITMTQGAATFGTIAHGATATQSNTIRFAINPEAACGSTVKLDLGPIHAAAGGPFPGATNIASAMIGSGGTSTLFYSDFTSDFPTWLVVDGGQATGGNASWKLSSVAGSPLSAPYAICDSATAGAPVMDEQLISQNVNCSGWSTVKVQFRHDFNWFPGSLDEHADVDVRSSATGGAWVTVKAFSGADASGVETVDVSVFAAGQTNLQVRFHYYNASFERWWAIDDTFVLGVSTPCDTTSFTAYGAPCGGATGSSPVLFGLGMATPGGFVTIGVQNGPPITSGVLLLASAPASLGCVNILPPFVGPIDFTTDASGEASLTTFLPATLTPGGHAYLQWFAFGGSSSNGLDIDFH